MKKEITHEEILKAIKDFAELTPTKNEVNDQLENVKNELTQVIDIKLEAVKTELKSEIESVKLRQDNVAYRFELNDLDKRVTKLETKAVSN